MAYPAIGLNRQHVSAVACVATVFFLTFLNRMSYNADKGSPPPFFANTWTNTKLSLPTDMQSRDKGATTNLGNCDKDRKFMPEGSRPLLLLLSFPGSGNTWVRYLIERSTGIYSGSFYQDIGTGNSDKSVWRKSNPCSKKTLVVKSHGWERFDRIRFGGKVCKVEGAILIIRNPYGAILADFNRMKKGKTGTAAESDFLTSKWKDFAETHSTKWVKTNTKGMGLQHKLVVFYEDLVKNTEYELRRMLDFLEVAHNESRIGCLMRGTAGRFKRVHKDLEINPFSAEINRTIDANIRIFRKVFHSKSNLQLPPYESSRQNGDDE